MANPTRYGPSGQPGCAQLSLHLPGDFDTAPPAPISPPPAAPSDPPRRRREVASTSIAAYHTVAVNAQARLVLDTVAASPAGLTIDEVVELLGLPVQSVSGRMSDLRRWGFLRRSGGTRPSRSGRASHVLVVATLVSPIEGASA